MHWGHLLTARDTVERVGLDGVLFVPASVSPFKVGEARASDADRVAMLALGLKELTGGDGGGAADGAARWSTDWSDMEMTRDGISYTVDTVRALRAERPEVDWHFVMGADNLAAFYKWREVEALMDLCTVVVMARPGFAMPAAKTLHLPPKRVAQLRAGLVDSREVEVSSSEIRDRVAAGLPINGLVPEAVRAYILEKGLYREDPKK